jgi:hypothetical protein
MECVFFSIPTHSTIAPRAGYVDRLTGRGFPDAFEGAKPCSVCTDSQATEGFHNGIH